MNLRTTLTLFLMTLTMTSPTLAQSIYDVVPVGAKIKLSLKIASSDQKNLKYDNALVIADGILKISHEFTPQAGDKFCWIDRDNMTEVVTQDEVTLEVEKYLGTKAILKLESSLYQRVTLVCGVKPNTGAAFSVLITPQNLQNITGDMISVVP